jgi:hypothetical protein
VAEPRFSPSLAAICSAPTACALTGGVEGGTLSAMIVQRGLVNGYVEMLVGRLAKAEVTESPIAHIVSLLTAELTQRITKDLSQPVAFYS